MHEILAFAYVSFGPEAGYASNHPPGFFWEGGGQLQYLPANSKLFTNIPVDQLVVSLHEVSMVEHIWLTDYEKKITT